MRITVRSQAAGMAFGLICLIGSAWGDMPVADEVVRSMTDPCGSKLEFRSIGDALFLTCPGCTVVELYDDPEDEDVNEDFRREMERAKSRAEHKGVSAYGRLIFSQVLEHAATLAMMSGSLFGGILSPKLGGAVGTVAGAAESFGLCE